MGKKFDWVFGRTVKQQERKVQMATEHPIATAIFAPSSATRKSAQRNLDKARQREAKRELPPPPSS